MDPQMPDFVVKVPANDEDEDLCWMFAWTMADPTKDSFKEWLEYDSEYYKNDECTFEYSRKGWLRRKRALGYIYEWALLGHKVSQRCFSAFMIARLTAQPETPE